jgi:hypothetical protein
VCVRVHLYFSYMLKENIDGLPKNKNNIQSDKFEKQIRKHLENFQPDDTLYHYNWNGLNII